MDKNNDNKNKKTILPLEKYIEEAKNTDKIIYEYKEKAIKEAYKEVKKYKDYIGDDNIDNTLCIEYATEDGINVTYSRVNGKEKIEVDLNQLARYAEDINKKYGNQYIIKVNIKESKFKNNINANYSKYKENKSRNGVLEEHKTGKKFQGIKILIYSFFKVIYLSFLLIFIYNIISGAFFGKTSYIFGKTINIGSIENTYTRISMCVTTILFSFINLIVFRFVNLMIKANILNKNLDFNIETVNKFTDPKFIILDQFYIIDYLYSLFKLKHKFNNSEYYDNYLSHKIILFDISESTKLKLISHIQDSNYKRDLKTCIRLDYIYYILLIISIIMYCNLTSLLNYNILDNTAIQIIFIFDFIILISIDLISINKLNSILVKIHEKFEVD